MRTTYLYEGPNGQVFKVEVPTTPFELKYGVGLTRVKK